MDGANKSYASVRAEKQLVLSRSKSVVNILSFRGKGSTSDFLILLKPAIAKVGVYLKGLTTGHFLMKMSAYCR